MLGLARPEPRTSVLLVIDVQDKLAPAMEPGLRDQMQDNLARLGPACEALGVRAVLTEQYPKGLGHTVPEVRAHFSKAEAFEKTAFAASDDETISSALEPVQVVVLVGVETHVCVFQTARALVDAGKRVLVVGDAVASRTRQNHATGLDLCARSGAIITSTESLLFDLVADAKHPAFRSVSKLVR